MVILREIIFNEEQVDHFNSRFKNIKIHHEQEAIALEMAKLLTQFIPLDERALNGFILYSIQKWQLNSSASG